MEHREWPKPKYTPVVHGRDGPQTVRMTLLSLPAGSVEVIGKLSTPGPWCEVLYIVRCHKNSVAYSTKYWQLISVQAMQDEWHNTQYTISVNNMDKIHRFEVKLSFLQFFYWLLNIEHWIIEFVCSTLYQHFTRWPIILDLFTEHIALLTTFWNRLALKVFTAS